MDISSQHPVSLAAGSFLQCYTDYSGRQRELIVCHLRIRSESYASNWVLKSSMCGLLQGGSVDYASCPRAGREVKEAGLEHGYWASHSTS
ncbi:uncharacterized protein LOC133650701 [Entelurus aequoreus]|uniref:uncharacterized protein LOC133650701 n=1 Tax=Entelurus aequoreus TaxID=161455 RepID=UPI002B1E6413|nr:uncharacterized protein LOC133650701 [Entelurus aequoreus]XP_061904246.1 uncharacterized protein LOC133650701 [Entelurus aequoreus]